MEIFNVFVDFFTSVITNSVFLLFPSARVSPRHAQRDRAPPPSAEPDRLRFEMDPQGRAGVVLEEQLHVLGPLLQVEPAFCTGTWVGLIWIPQTLTKCVCVCEVQKKPSNFGRPITEVDQIMSCCGGDDDNTNDGSSRMPLNTTSLLVKKLKTTKFSVLKNKYQRVRRTCGCGAVYAPRSTR